MKLLLKYLFFFFPLTLAAKEVPSVSFLCGAHFYQNAAVEFGISRNVLKGIDHGKEFDANYHALTQSLSSEFYFGDRFLIAPKYSIWWSDSHFHPIEFGCSMLYYSDLQSGMASVRPEIGIYIPGVGYGHLSSSSLERRRLVRKFKISYGYNFFMSNTLDLPAHLFSLVIFVEGNSSQVGKER